MSQSNGANSKRARLDRTPVQAWEPTLFTEMVDNHIPVLIAPELPGASQTLVERTGAMLQKLQQTVNSWGVPPPPDAWAPLSMIALFLESDVNWDPKSDILVGRIVATLTHHTLRAHSTGVFAYNHGNWQRVEEIPIHMLMLVEISLCKAEILMAHLFDLTISRGWHDVFSTLETFDWSNLSLRIDQHLWNAPKHWTAHAGRAFRDLPYRFTSSAASTRSKSLLDTYAGWFQRCRPPINNYIDLIDATLLVNGDKTLVQVPKKPDNDCYLHVPVSLTVNPKPESVTKLREVFATFFAGNEHGRMVDLALDVLALQGRPIPQKMVIYQGPGGDGKSARALLRSTVFGDNHAFISSTCFTEPEEMRKQGGAFAYRRSITIQECTGGQLLLEDIWKKFVSGKDLPCRPNYGISTQYYNWCECAKFWEMNLITPAIKGSPDNIPSLKSWIRRLIVIVMQSSFTPDTAMVDVENKVFVEDSDLRSFLRSGEARAAYILYWVIPFMQKFTVAETTDFITKPHKDLLATTTAFVQQMANGGLKPYVVPATSAEDQPSHEYVQAMEACIRVHKNMEISARTIKEAALNKLSFLAGTSKKIPNKETRAQLFSKAVEIFPFLFRRIGGTWSFKKSELDLEKFERVYSSYIRAIPGDWQQWGVLWDVLDEYEQEPQADNYDEEGINPFDDGAGNTLVEHLLEVVNLEDLKAYAAKGTDRRLAQLRTYIQRIESEGQLHHELGNGYVAIKVGYYMKHGLPGRRYAIGPSAQKFTKEARAIAFGKHALDVDLRNAHPSLLARFLAEQNCLMDYPMITSLNNAPDSWRNFLMDYHGYDKADAKTDLLKKFYFGRPRGDIPFMWALAREIRQSAMFILGQSCNAHLAGLFLDRRKPIASQLAYAMFALEDAAMQQLVAKLKSIANACVYVYMFDGCIVRPGVLNGNTALQTCVDQFEDETSLQVKIEKLA